MKDEGFDIGNMQSCNKTIQENTLGLNFSDWLQSFRTFMVEHGRTSTRKYLENNRSILWQTTHANLSAESSFLIPQVPVGGDIGEVKKI